MIPYLFAPTGAHSKAEYRQRQVAFISGVPQAIAAIDLKTPAKRCRQANRRRVRRACRTGLEPFRAGPRVETARRRPTP